MKKLLNHPDFKVQTVQSAVTCLRDEYKELLDTPSIDELSDVAFAVNRLAGALVNLKYLPIIPVLDIFHVRKKLRRIEEYGHFRSKRHL